MKNIMFNTNMILSALERYASYMYYAHFSDNLRPEDSQNLIDFIDTALETLIFSDPEPHEIDYKIASILNEAQTYAVRLNSLLVGSKSYYKTKTVFELIDKIYELTFCPNVDQELCV